MRPPVARRRRRRRIRWTDQRSEQPIKLRSLFDGAQFQFACYIYRFDSIRLDSGGIYLFISIGPMSSGGPESLSAGARPELGRPTGTPRRGYSFSPTYRGEPSEGNREGRPEPLFALH